MSQTGLRGSTTTTGTATSTANVAYTYDANGALLTDGLRHYAYDSEGRLAAASLGWSTPTGTGTSATTDDSITKYAHNALAQRVFKTAPLYAVTNPQPTATPTVLAAFTAFFESLWSPATGTVAAAQKSGMTYVYDEDGTLIADTLTGGATTTWGQSAKYIYLPTTSGPMPVAVIYGSGNTAKHYAIQSDHLNTPRRLTQSDGQVAWQWAYSAFGDEQPTIANNRFANTALNQSFGTTSVPAVTFNLRYPGQYYDQESNLHYNYHRSYSATLGAYTQADPIGLDGGWNRFGYVDSDPLSDTDPLGLSRLRGNANRPSTPILRPPPRPISLQPFSTYSTESMNQCGVCLQIYFIARLNGEQSGHRTIANNQFYQYLSSGASPLNARQVQRQMSSGSSGLLNPTGYEWHHPVGRPNEIWLVTRCDHRDSLLRPFIHPLPGGGGGFSENFPGGYR